MKPAQFRSLTPVALAAFVSFAVFLAGCTGGGAGSSGGGFVVLRTVPANNGKLFLNEAIKIDFTNEVDLSSADLNTFSFQVLDQNGNPLSEQPAGTFRIGTSPGDATPGRQLEFVPRFPTNDTYDNGGFRPGRQYLVQLVGGDRRNQTVLKDMGGRGLMVPVTFRFRTADGTTPAQLFRDTKPGGPRRKDFTVSPGGSLSSSINFLGRQPLEIRVGFDQALNPDSANVPVKLNNDPPFRDIAQRGRIFLEYDDPDPTRGRNSWIPADVDLESNSLSGAEVVLRPIGVLPNNATVRVIVENTLEDMAGESNVADASYNRIFANFQVRDADILAAGPPFDHTLGRYQPLFDAVVENFDSVERIDLGAPFLEPQARLLARGVQAGFAFEGTNTTTDFEPQVREVILDTVFTQVTPKNGPPINVSGGVFQFRDVRIPPNVTVRGTGLNPMVWLVTGNFVVEGSLNVDGGLGSRVDTLNSANFPTAGGVGVAGGGGGGRGSPNSIARSPSGESGKGPGQIPGGGGQGGRIDCTGCGGPPTGQGSRDGGGSGGGGGSFATQGDPWFHDKAAGPITFRQQVGGGGYGCSGNAGDASRVLPGGDPGSLAFKDARTDNNFWGSGVNIHRQIRVLGELEKPVGGSGGGGGGDKSISCDLSSANFISDNKGGGGGGGAGVLIVKALGRIEVTASGSISADGGDGGGGEQAGSNSQGGGGGGGSGGMVVLMAGDRIVLHVHGGTYGDDPNTPSSIDRDYNFVVSADGGVGLQGDFGGLGGGQVSSPIRGKYPPPGNTRWDNQPAGGFGGMGVVQLMAPPGDNRDATNTVLDDGIDILKNGVPLSRYAKQRYLAWRGFPDANGVLKDDFGKPDAGDVKLGPSDTGMVFSVDGNNADGDIRPSPVLLPVPFGQRSRVRSRWIDTGSSVRRSVSGTPFNPNEGPRGVIEDPGAGFLAGPQYAFAGSITDPGPAQGYADYLDPGTGTVTVQYPELFGVDGVRIASLNPAGTFDGRPAYEARLDPAGPGMGSVRDRYAHYRAELRNGSGVALGDFRILSHTDRLLVLSPDAGLLPPHEDSLPAGQKDKGAARLQVLSKFFDVVTDSVPGLGVSYQDSTGDRVPQANLRIGFAFHKNATRAKASGQDPDRIPTTVGTFLYDLADPATAALIRDAHAPYVQWDILFETRFKRIPNDQNEPPALSPTTPRPVLNYLIVPYRF